VDDFQIVWVVWCNVAAADGEVDVDEHRIWLPPVRVRLHVFDHVGNRHELEAVNLAITVEGPPVTWHFEVINVQHLGDEAERRLVPV